MINEEYISILLNMDKWEIHAPFIETSPIENNSPANKDLTKHNYHEILVGISGNYPYYFNGACYNCKPGSIFLISPMLEHESYYTDTPMKLKHMWMNFASDNLLAAVSEINGKKAKCLLKKKIEYKAYNPEIEILEIWNSLLKAKEVSPSALLRLKVAICRLFIAIINGKQMTNCEYQEEIMIRARAFIRENFMKRISLDYLANKMGYSKFHFINLFKRYHTVTVQEYIDQQRLKYVRTSLADKMSKKEIAHNLGFSSPSSFANWLSKYRDKI